jgi:putative transposase
VELQCKVELHKKQESQCCKTQPSHSPHALAWGGGYGAFSVSHSDVARVARYIANQEEHHRKRTYAEEYELFVKRYGLEWRSEKNH